MNDALPITDDQDQRVTLQYAAQMLTAALTCLQTGWGAIETNIDALHPTLDQFEQLLQGMEQLQERIDRERRSLAPRPTVVPMPKTGEPDALMAGWMDWPSDAYLGDSSRDPALMPKPTVVPIPQVVREACRPADLPAGWFSDRLLQLHIDCEAGAFFEFYSEPTDCPPWRADTDAAMRVLAYEFMLRTGSVP